MGPLILAAESHKHGILEHLEQEDAFSYIFKGRKFLSVPLQHVSGNWSTIDYHAGDLLTFHSLAVHQAVPNRSDNIRFSADTRCQPAKAPRMWQLEKTILELRQYRSDVRRMAIEEGASEELSEAVLIQIHSRGFPAEQEHVVELIAELSCTAVQSLT